MSKTNFLTELLKNLECDGEITKQAETFSKVFTEYISENVDQDEDLLNRYRRNEKERNNLNATINKMPKKEQDVFWKRYHGTESEINDKLDILIETIALLNRNVNERFDDLESEIQILRKEIKGRDILRNEITDFKM